MCIRDRYIREPFIDRSVLIDAGRANFLFELKRNDTHMSISIVIYFVGVDHGVFETQQFGKFKIEIGLIII